MRIVFIGASELGYNCCESCIKEGHSIVGIITLGKEFSIKYKEQKERTKVTNVLYKDFKNFQDQYNIPVIVAEHPIAHAYDVIESWKPDLIIVIGWYYMIPEKIMNLPNKGVIGIHASLLPKYRGNAPLVWAMINGEKETGVSLFYIEAGTDEGDILGQERIDIKDCDHIADVLQKAEKLSIKLLQKHLLEIKAGTAQRIIQDHTLATLYPKRSPEDGLINWQLRSDQIRNFIRAQSRPYPGAFTIINGMKIIIYEGAIGREMSIQPGQIFHKNEKDKKVIIGCGQNTTLEVSELEFEGIAYKAADILKDQELIQTK